MALSAGSTSTEPNLCSFPAETTTKLRSGHTRVDVACSLSMGISITFGPSSSIMSFHGSFQPPTIRLFGYGTGRTVRSVCFEHEPRRAALTYFKSAP